MTADPTRWLDDGEAPSDLRLALEVAEDSLPTERELASLEARLAPLFGPGGGGGGGSGGDGGSLAIPRPPLGGVAIAAGVVATLATVTGVVWVAIESEPRAAPPIAEAPVTETDAGIVDAIDAGFELDAGVEVRVRARVRPVEQSAMVETIEPPIEPPREDPAAELVLIRDARRAIASDPSRALELTRDHERRFPTGQYVQERERIAIESLVRLGSRAQAIERADRFRARYPRSSLLPRIDAVLGR